MSVRDAPKAVALSTQSADPVSVDPAPARPALPPVRDPRRYEVIGEHGRGGLGRVQRVHDHELGRDVAIKELLSRGPISERRFEREARITARLEHPGIVPLYEAGRWPDGTPFYAMKLVSGRPLRALIAERTTVDDRIGLLHHVIAVADAMAYAHGRNIIHRDLKPGNVIVGDFGETVVIDWGLAKDLSDSATIGGAGSDSGSPAEPDLTTAGSVLGTPAYMPPEQERGEAVDQRADVFAIGAMLWELCSLHRVPPTDRRARHALLRSANIDDDLIAIVDKAIAPDPAQRYRDAGEMAADLRAFKSGARISARRYSLAAVLRHWTRRHRALAALAIALTATVIIGIALLAWLYRGSEANAALARAQLTQSYVEQGRRALLDERFPAALPFLVEAARRGDHSMALRFMLERAAEPLETESVRLPAMSPRASQARFSHDGTRILTGDDSAARIWDRATGRLLFSMPHDDFVAFVRFTADDRRVVSVGGTSVKVWDALSGVLIRTIAPVELSISRGYVALSPGGELVAAVNRGSGFIDVWAVDTGILTARLPFAASRSPVVEFSSDGRWLATTSRSSVTVFDTRSWRLAAVLDAAQPSALAFDPTSSRIAIGTELGDVSVRGVPDGRPDQNLLHGGESVNSLAYSPDGAWLAAGFFRSSGSETIWNAHTGAVQTRLAKHVSGVVDVRFDPSSKLLLSGGPLGSIVVSDVSSGVPVLLVQGSQRVVGDMQFSSDSRHIVAALFDGTVGVWDLGTSYRVGSTEGIDITCGKSVALDEDRRYVAVNCPGRTVRVWDSTSLRLIAELPAIPQMPGDLRDPLPALTANADRAAIAQADRVDVYALPGQSVTRAVRHPARVTTVQFERVGHLLASGSSDGTVVVSDDGGECLRRNLGAKIDTVAVLPHRRLLVMDEKRRMTVYRIDDGVELASFPLASRANGVRVSMDGRRVIVIPAIQYVDAPALYDVEKGIVAWMVGHKSQVYSAKFTQDDRVILTAGTDGAVRLWDGTTGLLQKVLYSEPGMLLDAAISPDGSLIVTAGGDGNLRFWDVASGTMMWRLRAHGLFVSGVHFEGDLLISRSFNGDLAQWRIPPVRGGADWLARFEKLVANGPWRLDTATGALVANAGRQ